MSRYADALYAMSSGELWEAFRRGCSGAAQALFDRYDGIPPVPNPEELPHAVVWARLLAQEANPFTTPTTTGTGMTTVSSPEGART
jgi:hypothetical protein